MWLGVFAAGAVLRVHCWPEKVFRVTGPQGRVIAVPRAASALWGLNRFHRHLTMC